MDVYCKRCGEPWDLFEISSEFSSEERDKFWKGEGCPCCFNKEIKKRPTRAKMTEMLQEILGDDIDGIAAELEDMEFFNV